MKRGDGSKNHEALIHVPISDFVCPPPPSTPHPHPPFHCTHSSGETLRVLCCPGSRTDLPRVILPPGGKFHSWAFSSEQGTMGLPLLGIRV